MAPRSSIPIRRAAGLIAIFLLIALAACAPNAPQDTLRPDGPIGRQINSLFWPIFAIATIIFALVEGGILFIALRWRDRKTGYEPEQTHGNTRLEIAWTAVPAVLLAGVAVFTIATIVSLARDPGENALKVKVVAHQWWWEYQYPDLGVVTANELHIPVGTPVSLQLESQDVIHSFWVPKLAGKQDVVPGRTNRMTLLADKPGTHFGQCAEFCGISHANMRLIVVAQAQSDFDAWVAGQLQPAVSPSGALAAEGERIFMAKACVGCHTVEGTQAQGKVGPDLTHLASRMRFAGALFDVTSGNLSDWLKDPPAMKPMQPDKGIGMPNLHLTEREIVALVAYLETLR